jgi:hypothetical protein
VQAEAVPSRVKAAIPWGRCREGVLPAHNASLTIDYRADQMMMSVMTGIIYRQNSIISPSNAIWKQDKSAWNAHHPTFGTKYDDWAATSIFLQESDHFRASP